jgi:3-oxoacyl-[acyl-carrier protein] reductase
MDLGIKGRVAIVTGGSRGIGKETSREFLEAGVKVMTCSRHGDELNETCKELAKTTGGEIHSMVADMTNPEDIKKLVNKTLETYGTVDILINNAGTMYSGRFAELTDEGLQTQLDTKLFGFMRAIRAVSPIMREKKWGRIVSLIGGAGKEPDPYMFGSGMTNSALLNLTKSLSTEFAPDNVLVNAVCPGWVATQLWRQHAEGLKKELGVIDPSYDYTLHELESMDDYQLQLTAAQQATYLRTASLEDTLSKLEGILNDRNSRRG